VIGGNALSKILDFYFYSSIHIAISATLFIVQTYILLSIDIDYNYLLFLFSSTLFLYLLHNILGIFTSHNQVIREKIGIIRKMKSTLIPFLIISGIISIYSFLNLAFDEIISLSVFAFISIWYVLPIFGDGKRLSDYPIIKIFMVSLVWAAIATIIPLSDTNMSKVAKAIIFMEKYLFIFAITIPFDIRDIEFDSSRAVKTIPIIFGKRNSIVISIFSLLCALGFVFLLYDSDIYMINQTIAMTIGYITSIVIVIFSENKTSDYYFTGIVDGLPIFNFIMVLISIWI